MFKQRIRTDHSPLTYVSRVLLLIVLLALAWYGLMLLLLALKTSADTVNSISGYRTVFNFFDDLDAEDISGRVRWITALAGLGTFLVAGYLALKEIPRPRVARHNLTLEEGPQGVVTVEPRSIERIAEGAARGNGAVSRAAGRYGGEDLTVDVSVSGRDVPAILRDVQTRVREALVQHGVPVVPVTVILAGFDRPQGRELK